MRRGSSVSASDAVLSLMVVAGFVYVNSVCGMTSGAWLMSGLILDGRGRSMWNVSCTGSQKRIVLEV